jgi:multicomponent Na+:H+ antiporter subunit B
VVAGPLYWLILAASVWVLLRGHNEPGGGFIGGLVAVSAIDPVGGGARQRRCRRRLPLRDPADAGAAGVLGLAALAGVPALWGEMPS